MKLLFRTPMRWDALSQFLSARAINGIDEWRDGRYHRDGVTVDGSLTMTAPTHANRDDLTRRARRMFDLDCDPGAISRHLRRDPVLRPNVKSGTRVPGSWEPFETAVRAVVGQQISVAATTTIMHRLAPLLTPSSLAEADIGGMPRARANAIRSLARAVADDPSLLTRGPTLDESIERLTALPGIGPWTAHYIAMRALGEPDAFPHSDLGLRKAAASLGITDLLSHAERWRPFRAYAAITLWETL